MGPGSIRAIGLVTRLESHQLGRVDLGRGRFPFERRNTAVEMLSIVIPLLIGLPLIIRVAAGQVDRRRIEEDVRSRGGYITDIRWRPFGPGWFGEKESRIYQVEYVDREGSRHQAYCKTSLWSGVYFTQDQVIGIPKPKIPLTPPTTRWGTTREAELESENRELREELERLRKQAEE